MNMSMFLYQMTRGIISNIWISSQNKALNICVVMGNKDSHFAGQLLNYSHLSLVLGLGGSLYYDNRVRHL